MNEREIMRLKAEAALLDAQAAVNRQRQNICLYCARHDIDRVEEFIQALDFEIDTYLDFKDVRDGIEVAQTVTDFYVGYRMSVPYMTRKYVSLVIARNKKRNEVEKYE